MKYFLIIVSLFLSSQLVAEQYALTRIDILKNKPLTAEVTAVVVYKSKDKCNKDLFKIRDKGLENAEGVTFKDDVLTIKYLMAHYRYKCSKVKNSFFKK